MRVPPVRPSSLVPLYACNSQLLSLVLSDSPMPSGDLVNLLGGSWVVISKVISRVTILITHIRGLITPLITTLNPKTLNPIPL